jgi:hypothetical protein
VCGRGDDRDRHREHTNPYPHTRVLFDLHMEELRGSIEKVSLKTWQKRAGEN